MKIDTKALIFALAERKLSVDDFAKMMQVRTKTVGVWLTRGTAPFPTVQRIAEALQINPVDLMSEVKR